MDISWAEGKKLAAILWDAVDDYGDSTGVKDMEFAQELANLALDVNRWQDGYDVPWLDPLTITTFATVAEHNDWVTSSQE
jgi:hypothetical protein